MRKTIIVLIILCTVILTLTGCGSPSPGADVFTDANAWKGTIPGDADIISPDDFRKRVGSGELVITSTASIADAAAARETAYEGDRASLKSVAQPSPVLQDLLAEADGQPTFEGDRPLKLPDGNEVVVYGLGTQLRNAVDVVETSRSADNALTDYRQTYELLPADVKAGAATPDSLKGKSAEQIREALHALNEALSGNPALRGARLERAAVAPGAASAGAISTQDALRPGAGTDHDTPCTQPTGLVAQYWFPLKNFLPGVKDQARRGTCWAFTAIGAVESRERVQNDNPVDLSEQFLVNKVKQDWDSNDYSDGYWSERALDTAVDKGQALLGEAGWTYNPARNRPSVKDGDEDSYDHACDPYGIGPNGGTCSETSHESRRYCSTFIITVCGYARVDFGGPGVGASDAYQVWANGQPFDLNRYRLLLSQGYVLMASFQVYRGFMDDVGADGIVSNYAKTKFDDKGKEVDGSYGGHAVQVVGFLSNEEMSKPGRTPVNIGGGGYFIIKNSWGCGAGDGGYYYVPADYVSRLFGSLSALAFDLRRSTAWNDEQKTPGGSDAPTIQIKSNPAKVDLRVETDIATFFKVAHPVAKSVNLKVSSSLLGTIYDGPWSTDADALFGPVLKYTFPHQGDQYLALTARYGKVSSQAILHVLVVNSPPTLDLDAAGTVYQNEPFTITAKVFDKNEAGVAGLCANTTWTVSDPDTLSSSSGCQVQVTFGATGSRTVQASTHDTEGLTATKTFNPTVQPPPVNPYPRISGGGVYALDSLFFNGQFAGCISAPVSVGAVIDLRDIGCSITAQNPHRYSASVSVENPDVEALTYDWRLYVTYESGEVVYNSTLGSTSSSVDLYNTGNTFEVTVPCRENVVVHAPDPSRDKSMTVWTGQCTFDSYVLH